MATVVLTAVGAMFGGPVGGAIGAVAGQFIDRALFKPKARHGPRIGDLAVQTSSYGAALPKLFGTMRVAGTVIWATDLKEERSRTGGGKGRRATVTYSYSASFAVALSARRIGGIGRIWADGKLLRGAAGDWKAETAFRFHPGSEEQEPDPLIAAVEGGGRAPAYRGLAYAVFQDLQLGDFGNRVPSLSFEVIADGAAVGVGEIAAELSGGLVTGADLPLLGGYAASGSSVRGAIEALTDVLPLSATEEEAGLRLRSAPSAVRELGGAEAGASAAGVGGRSEFARRSAAAGPADVSLAYIDPARDYQPGLQRALRGGTGGASDRQSLPAAIPAGQAKELAELRLAHGLAGRETAKIHLRAAHVDAWPGAALRIGGAPGLWKVVRWTLEQMVVSLELRRLPAATAHPAVADAGRPTQEPDAPHGPTSLFLFDLPHLGEGLAERPQLAVLAAGVERGWRRAALSLSLDGGVSWTNAGGTAAPAVLGRAVTVLSPGGAALLDRRSIVDIELLHDGLWLESRSDDALAAGANVAVLGEEIIQFGAAEPLGGGRFRLSRLLRGRRGTESAAAAHQVGEAFALLETDTATLLDVPAGIVGSEVHVMAQGIGDGDAPVAAILARGRALEPPSPVHIEARRDPDGAVHLSWVRRSRIGWLWGEGGDAPLGEDREAYRLRLSGGGRERVVVLSEPRLTYSAADQIADGASGPLSIEVVQIGTHALSRPATLSL